MDVGRIDGPREVVPERRPTKRDTAAAKPAKSQDAVNISPEAQRASELARFVSLAKNLPDVREAAVIRARNGLQKGILTDDDVLRETARRVLKDLKG